MLTILGIFLVLALLMGRRSLIILASGLGVWLVLTLIGMGWWLWLTTWIHNDIMRML